MDVRAWRRDFAAFLTEPGPWGFVAGWAEAARCLPVYVDWTHAIGVAEDGAVIAFAHEPNCEGPATGERVDLRWQNVALRFGLARHPWLAELLPARPADAQTCSVCAGTGRVPVEGLVCHCGGAGWVPADDAWNRGQG